MLGFIRLGNKKIFLRQIYTSKKKGVDLSFLENNPIEFPCYIYDKEFDNWAKEIAVALNIPEVVVKTELLFPKQDMQYVETYPVERHEKLWTILREPFYNFPERIIHWFLNVGYQWVQSRYELIEMKYGLEKVWPATHKEFKRLKAAVSIFPGASYLNYDIIARMINQKDLDDWDLMLIGIQGHTHKKEKELLRFVSEKCGGPNIAREYLANLFAYYNSTIMRQINLKYFEIKPGKSITLETLMKAGVKLKDLFPRYTKKERNKIVEKAMHYDLYDLAYKAVNAAFGDKLPPEWLSYIQDVEVARWAVEKKDQLSRYRIIHGPGGTTARFEYHIILGKITPEMLTHGPKTSFRKIWEILGQQELELTKALVGKKVEFKTLPFPKKWEGKITPLTNSVELFEEGEKMSHCVGGSIYQEACIRGISYIYHVGAPAPEGATFEISKHNREKYELCQIYAYEDKPPRNKEKTMAEEFVKDINELIEERR